MGKMRAGVSQRWLEEEPPRLVTPPPTSVPRHQHRPRPRTTLLLVYWVSRAIGILPLRYNNTTQKLEISKCNVFYSILSMSLLFAQWCFMTEEIHTYSVQEGNIMSGLEPIILTVLNSTLLVVALLRSTRLSRVVSILAGLDAELSPRGPGPSMLPCVLPGTLVLLACTADIATSLVDSTLWDTLTYMPYYWGAIGAVLVETQFNSACFALRYWFWLLNERLKACCVLQTVRRRAPGAALRLEALRLTHGRLCLAAVELEAVFGPQLLLCCGLCFAGTVLNAYFGVNGFYDVGAEGSATDTMQQMQWLWASLYLCRISAVCFAATSLTAEAINTGRLVHTLSDSRLAPEMKEEITMFSMQISTSKIEFTAWGIVAIDFSLLFAIVSSTTTYLLILIQYRPK